MRAHPHTHMQARMLTLTHTHTRTHTVTPVYTHMHTHSDVCAHMHKRSGACVHTHTIHMICTLACTLTQHLHMLARAHTHTHTHTHTHACTHTTHALTVLHFLFSFLFKPVKQQPVVSTSDCLLIFIPVSYPVNYLEITGYRISRLALYMCVAHQFIERWFWLTECAFKS